MDDDPDQALLLHAVKAVLDLVLVGPEQRAAALECDADLRARETAWPAVNNPADRARDSAEIEHEDVDGREAAAFSFRHVAVKFIFSSRRAGRSWAARL